MRQKGPLLAFDSFEEETFLVVPLANASHQPTLLQDRDSNLEAHPLLQESSTLSLELLWASR